MSGITLRPYQMAAIHKIFDAFEEGFTRVLYTLPTGTGKTATFSEIVRILREYHQKKVLILAHRSELINQAYWSIRKHCDLDEWQIGIELADTKASLHNEVIVGSVMTVKGGHRMPGWKPDVIITDESHRAAARSYAAIYERFGVNEGTCLHIGCTATAKRTDRQSLFAIKPDDTPVELWDKKKTRRTLADPATSVYQKHVYEYSILDAVEDGYLTPIVGHTVQTETDLSEVKTANDGDFMEAALAKAVDNAKRTVQGINAWKELAENRPTIVFCASVEHAYHAAQLWREAGYTAEALGGDEAQDTFKRANMLADFKAGKLQVLCNCGLYTEGTDLPTAACIVHLRPTKSWNLYVQMSGRGTRVLPGLIDGIEEAEARRNAIAGSIKPNCLIIDLVDICAGNDLCAAPSILDLPAELDLEGHSLNEAKKLLEDFEDAQESVIGECPVSFSELKVRLEQVELLRSGKAASGQDWKATAGGYRFCRTEIGYQGELVQSGDLWEMVVRHAGKEIARKAAKRIDPKTGQPFGEHQFLDAAARHIAQIVTEYKASLPPVSRGTLQRLTVKQINCLKANGHSAAQIDNMTYAYARAKIEGYMAAWKSRREIAEYAPGYS